MIYRPEIDGLRAISVLAVILFHAGFPYLPAGYYGVDVFFVISGFLITSIILTEHKEKNFTLLHFYERRARRILPPLYLVAFACIPFSWSLMSTGLIWDFWQSLISAPLFLTNLLFTLELGYFDPPAKVKPLIHIWSLSVEEQFYLLFPLLFIGLISIRCNIAVFAIIFIAILSYFWAIFDKNISLPVGHLNQQLQRLDDAGWASFYMPIGRAWELLIGALAAIIKFKASKCTNSVLLSNLGFTVVIFSMVFVVPAHHEQSIVYSIWPVLGTMMVILFSSNGEGVARYLSNKVLVTIGMMSYGLYLWHQPIFAFYQLSKLGEISVGEWILLIILCFILSSLMWKFVERPFRSKTNVSLRTLLLFSVFGGIALIMIGFFGLSEAGRDLHYASLTRNIPESHHNMVLDLRAEGNKAEKESNFPSLPFANTDKTKALLIGDSQMGNWVRAINAKKQRFAEGFEFRSLTLDAPCYQYLKVPTEVSNTCSNTVTNFIATSYLDESDVIFLLESFQDRTIDHLDDLLEYLAEKKNKLIVVLNAEFTDLTRLSMALAKQPGNTNPNALTTRQQLYKNRLPSAINVGQKLKETLTNKNIYHLDEYHFYCNSSSCTLYSSDNEPYLYDTMHITGAGAIYLSSQISNFLRRLPTSLRRAGDYEKFQETRTNSYQLK